MLCIGHGGACGAAARLGARWVPPAYPGRSRARPALPLRRSPSRGHAICLAHPHDAWMPPAQLAAGAAALAAAVGEGSPSTWRGCRSCSGRWIPTKRGTIGADARPNCRERRDDRQWAERSWAGSGSSDAAVLTCSCSHRLGISSGRGAGGDHYLNGETL
jgi:hypothetical protein